jgi:hypothetical protein
VHTYFLHVDTHAASCACARVRAALAYVILRRCNVRALSSLVVLTCIEV